MNVEELLDILTNEVKEADRKNAQIEIWEGEQEYEIESMGGFSLSPDIVIQIKKTESAIAKPMVFKKEHQKMVEKTVKKIKKQIKAGLPA